ncbi:hypothetical protein M758_8G056800 [Ceratodon purpureus]|nr:hypothetical protein M758_8G056800 [Ceratodon purpureus]
MMDRAMALWGGGAAVTLACVRPSSASPAFDSRNGSSSRVQQRDKVPGFVDIVVEVPKGSFVKRLPDGAVDYVGPMPSPFNYGSVPAIPAPDGDPLDALILGNHLPYGYTGRVKVKGVMKFIDAGLVDDKLICTQLIPAGASSSSGREGEPTEPASEDLTMLDLFALTSFFNVYAACKSTLNTIRGKTGRTAYEGWELFEQ